jgi:protein O-mannosyl-transferase
VDRPEAQRLARRRKASLTFLLVALLISLLSCAINLDGINTSEVIDDHDLLHNPSARGCGRNPLDCFRHPQFHLYYRPVLAASFSIGENLHGQAPRPYHVENLALHGLMILEACWALRMLLRRDRAALIAGLLFAVHPLQVPVTTFIGGRTDTLALVFVLAWVIAALKSARGGSGPWWRIAAVAAFTAAIFCKEQCAALGLLVPLLGARPRSPSRGGRPPQIERWMLAYAIPVIVLIVAASRTIPPGAIDTVGWRATPERVAWSPGLRIEMVGRTLWFYARAVAWPTPVTLHQSSLGPWDVPQPLAALGGFFAAGLWLAATIHAWPIRRRRLLALWVVVSLAPCLNIVPIPSQFVACYRAVIPLFGIAGLAGLVLDRVLSALALRRVSGLSHLMWAIPAAALALLSLSDVPMWHSDRTIMLAQMRSDPNFLAALAGYATALRREGRREEAVAADNEVVERLFPTQHSLQSRLAAIDTPWMLRNVKSQTSLRYQPRATVIYVMRDRGGALQELGRYLSAIDDYRLELALQPDDEEVANALFYCAEMSGKYDIASETAESAIKRNPSASNLRRLGVLYLEMGRRSDAKRILARALARAVHEHSPDAGAILKLYEKTVGWSRRQ